MRKLAAFVLAAVLFVSSSISAAAPKILSSITPLQFSASDDSLQNYCTAGKINGEKGLWLTAAHCVDDHMYMQGKPVFVIDVNEAKDLAVVMSPTAVGTPLQLADRPSDWGGRVETAGYSFGYPKPFYFTGNVAHPGFVFPGEDQEFVLYDMPVAGGQSGSPILNNKGKLVGVMQVGFRAETFGVVSGGAPFRYVKEFAGKYFKR